MRITVPHYFDFGAERELVGGDLVRPEAWDAIRTESSGPFGLPPTRERWERMVDGDEAIAERARRIDAILAERDARSLASYGVGVAMVELWLKRMRPQRPLAVGEYAPATVGRLRDLFAEAEVHQHDLLADPPLPGDWHLFHRIDTEFDNRQWHQVLERFRDRPILVVAGEMIDWRRALTELGVRLRNRRATRAGLVRNGAAFEALWRHCHDPVPVEVHDLHGWVLTPRA